MFNTALISGSLFGMLSVIIGAFGAHGLRKILSEDQSSLIDSFETGVRYQMYHALVLLVLGLVMNAFPDKSGLLRSSMWCFISGIILFSGSIYALVGLKIQDSVGLGKLGIVTPIGGLLLVTGWMLMFIYFLRR